MSKKIYFSSNVVPFGENVRDDFFNILTSSRLNPNPQGLKLDRQPHVFHSNNSFKMRLSKMSKNSLHQYIEC